MKAVIERLANELPTIAVGAFAAARVAGIDLDQDLLEGIVEAGQYAAGFLLWLLVRRNTDGPVTAWRTWHASDPPS